MNIAPAIALGLLLLATACALLAVKMQLRDIADQVTRMREQLGDIQLRLAKIHPILEQLLGRRE